MYLRDNENVAVMVSDGDFSGVMARKEEDVYHNADLIQEAMVNLKKKNDYNNGFWLWIFTDNFKVINGVKL